MEPGVYPRGLGMQVSTHYRAQLHAHTHIHTQCRDANQCTASQSQEETLKALGANSTHTGQSLELNPQTRLDVTSPSLWGT